MAACWLSGGRVIWREIVSSTLVPVPKNRRYLSCSDRRVWSASTASASAGVTTLTATTRPSASNARTASGLTSVLIERSPRSRQLPPSRLLRHSPALPHNGFVIRAGRTGYTVQSPATGPRRVGTFGRGEGTRHTPRSQL